MCAPSCLKIKSTFSPCIGSPSSIYEQLFICLRDSSDLHIYKDLYGENECFFPPVWSLSRFTAILLNSVSFLLSLYSIQLFRERLSNKTVRDNAERHYV